MPTEKVIHYIEEILSEANRTYPGSTYVWSLRDSDDDNKNLEAWFNEALEITIEEGLIAETNGSHRITPSGRDVLQNGGYKIHLQKVLDEAERQKHIEDLNYEKLTQELKKVRAENKWYKWLSIIGALGFLMQVFQMVWSLIKHN